MEICKMSFQANHSNGMESSDNEIKTSFHLPVLIDDPNGNEVPCSIGISPETINATTPLSNGNCMSPDVQMFPFNIGVDVRKTTSDQASCRLQGICGPELEMAKDYLCEHAASVVTDSLSSSSDDQYMTANLSWNSKSSVTDPGQCMLEHKQNHTVKSQLPCIEALSEYDATDVEHKLNISVKNEAHLQQKVLEHHVPGNSLKLGITDHPNDKVIRITTNMERSLEYSILLSESELEMKGSNVSSTEHESRVPVLESSEFSNSSNDPIVLTDLSSEAFESPGESELMNDTKMTYQLPVATNFNSKECAVGVPNHNFRERVSHSVTTSADVYECVPYQPKETVRELPIINEQCYEEIDIERPNIGMAVAEDYKNSMNATFIVIREVDNDLKPGSEIMNWMTEAQELVPQAGTPIQGNVNETFLVSSPTIHEHSQTSTPLPESKKMVFSSPFQNLTHLPDCESCSTPVVEESPTNLVLQSNTRDPVEKPCFKIKCNTNMKAKLTKVEIKCYPKPNFNNVKPKVVSRAQQMSSPKSNLALSAEGSSKSFPRSISSISSSQSPCSPSPAPKHVKKEPLSKSALKPKSAILKFQKVVFRKPFPTNKQSASALAENKISKFSCNNSPQTRPQTTPAFANGAESLVCGSLHCSKSPLSSVEATTRELNKTFHYDGTERTKPSKQIIPVVEKPRARCKSLAGALDDHWISFNPVSATAAALKKVYTTEETPLTEASAHSISEVQVGRRPPLGNTRSLTIQSPSAKVRVPPSVSKSRLGSANKDGRTGIMQCPNKQPLIPATVASTNRGGDGPRKCVLSACTSSIRTQSTKSIQKNKSVSVKTPCRGAYRNFLSTPSQILPGSASKSARQLGISGHKLKADRTLVKSNTLTEKPGSRTPRASTQAPPDLLPVEKKAPGLPHYRTKCEKQIKWIAWLKELLKTSNQRFEAVAIVVQYLQAQQAEVGKQHNELSQELLTLHSELETRNLTCVKLEKDGEELQNKYEGLIQKLSEEHQTEIKGLEERLEQLFTAEKEHLQQTFKDEVGNLQAQLQKEIEGLTSKHEAYKLELVATHSKKLECLEREYEQNLAELTRSHELDQKTLEESFKERQSLFQDQIAELNKENDSLKEEIKIKEEVTKAQGQKDQKIDPQSLYLEQELESLKAVLEIKNEKIHHQEKKLMQMEKLMEKHIVLDEKLKIVLQENEDLKARMDKHIAVSRQLSSEQVVLQESLHKESKVNKRLSMENEELLWKLQNGDVLSPKKLSPTSSFSCQPSRNSMSSSPAPSPR
ncbi:microtubule-associated tumor suppressor 1 homolog isoform X2 [Heptranchias perlo]|uniref:microtubule-associated tumor suppressor 1 homolog isoform X2 n=1 Tax=Heptranchias perlo TaxID=212740 RepID=UPI003559E3E2